MEAMSNNMNPLLWVLGIIVVLAAVWFVLGSVNKPSYPAYTTTVPQQAPQTSRAPVLLIDPPALPAGTQSLIVSYSSVAVHASGGPGSGWINASGSGSINLLDAVNVSKVIGYANISANTTLNLVRLNITSAEITINGTAYNVSVPNPSLTVAVTGRTKINSTAAVLIDVSPVITAVYSQNATSFIMAPAAKATVVSSSNAAAQGGIGASVALNASARASLLAAAPNITITSASISRGANNVTNVAVTVKDNSNSSVTLNGVFIQGKQNVSATQSAGLNASVASAINGVLGGGSASANAKANLLAKIGLNIHSFSMMSFAISSDSTLFLPSSNADFQSGGYTLSAGSSMTFSFSGKVSYDSGMFVAETVAGSPYVITVIGNGGAWATTTANGS